MNILTTSNCPYNLDTVPEEADDVRYCVLDLSTKDGIDFYYQPLIFLESFTSPAAVLRIGNRTVQMPLDWSILVTDSTLEEPDLVPITSLNDRGFETLVFNPFKGMTVESEEITIVNVYAEVKWHFPRLRPGHVLVVPLEDSETPKCALFVKDTAKIVDFSISDFL